MHLFSGADPTRGRRLLTRWLATGLCIQVALAFVLPQTTAQAGGAPDGLLLVANKTDQSLGIIDLVAGTMLTTVPLQAQTGHEVAASPDGSRAFVPIYGNSGVGRKGTDGQLVRVVDLARREVVHTVDLGKGMRPHCAVFGPRDGLLYVTTEIDDCVTILDPDSLRVVGRVPTGQPESHMLAISSDGKRGYTANVGPGTVSVLDLVKRKPLAVIPVAPKVQRIAISPDDKWVFTADQTKARVAVIDAATSGVRQWVELPGIGYGLAVTPDNQRLIVCLIGLSKVAEVDLAAMKLTRTLDVPQSPQEVLIRPDGAVAYVSCDKSGQVAAVDLRQWHVEKLIAAGQGADGLAWASARSPRK